MEFEGVFGAKVRRSSAHGYKGSLDDPGGWQHPHSFSLAFSFNNSPPERR